MKIGNRDFEPEYKPYIMGILNMTPDSFSDGGKWETKEKALKHVEEMIAEGMDLLDIGGESTRPGYTLLSEEEEIRRVVPVIEAVKAEFDIPVSLDTYKATVAEAGLRAGADLVNDIWGLRYERESPGAMARVIAKSGAACCLMHNRRHMDYGDFRKDVTADLTESLRIAKAAGIRDDKIILDPGVGFGKSYEQNLEVLNHLEEWHSLGYPLLLGSSRKSVVGRTLALPVAERLEGTLVTTVFAVLKGYAFVRVHEVKENLRAIRMTRAILGAEK
ncbi:MAG: dihydropteroate synthase [Clostridium sp.]|nr:dihydropteroate synthase [Clostridium sp.]